MNARVTLASLLLASCAGSGAARRAPDASATPGKAPASAGEEDAAPAPPAKDAPPSPDAPASPERPAPSGQDGARVDATTPVAPGAFVHRSYLGWVRDLASQPRPDDAWPSIVIDETLLRDYDETFAMMARDGLGELVLWGLFTARAWSVDVEHTIDDARAGVVRQLIARAHARGIRVLAGVGVYSWGFDDILRANPQLGCKNSKSVMNPFLAESWTWQRRVIDYVMGFGLDGVSMQSGDQGRCDCGPTCTALGDLEYHAKVNDQVAAYVKGRWPDRVVGISGWGMNLGKRADLPQVVAMTRHVDYLIDVSGTAAGLRADLVKAIAPCAYGTTGTPNVEPPQHWDRDRWFLPILQRLATSVRAVARDGGRAAENYMRVLANPGDEVAIRLAAALERDPGADAAVVTDALLRDIYRPDGDDALAGLRDVFRGAEDAYFANARGVGADAIVRLEPLVGDHAGPPVYLTATMDAARAASYRAALADLRAQVDRLMPRVGNQDRLRLVARCLDRAMADAATLK